MKHLSTETKIIGGIFIATIAIIIAALFMFSKPPVVLSRNDLIPTDSYFQGNKDAKTYLVEFSDLQCPACKAFEPLIKSIMEAHKDKLLFVYRHFPLDQHPYSHKSAIAAEAAGQQGKFWEMHDALFAIQETLSDDTVTKQAEALKLDMDAFKKAIADSNLADKVNRDRSYGDSIGVNSTPSFYLNGRLLNLSSAEDLKKAVDEATK